MKKLICLLASAALFGACEQKTEVVAPAAPPVDNKKTEANTSANPPASTETGAKPAKSTETKTESTTTTTTTASPNP